MHVRVEVFKVSKVVRNIFVKQGGKSIGKVFKPQINSSLKNIETIEHIRQLQTVALGLGKSKSQIVLLEEPNYRKLQKILSIRVLQP